MSMVVFMAPYYPYCRIYEYPLKDAVKAHEALESGSTLGATVLIP